MALTPGTRLGVYEVTEQIGAGGMGEVYRATDSNLKRSVAIKVLPASVAGDADRLARFQREAEVLAALNHPNIAAIHGLEKTPDFTALVMELVEGEDLSQHIARGAIPLGEALPIAKQIAEALEAAHEQGIIHRDLKPANIKVRSDGAVKVLDFGLAKAMDPAGTSSANAMNSPTLSMHATQAGIILGTAAYMSPEQARGKTVDKRADIWAFGVVLFEMLAGRRPFEGDDISLTLASVLKSEPSWNALPADTPLRLRRLLERCLDRDVKQRLRDIGEARVEIAKTESGAPDSAIIGTATLQARRSPELLAWGIALTAVLAVIAIGLLRLTSVATDSARSVRLPFLPPDNAALSEVGGTIVSPDGQKLLFSARSQDGRRLLWVRALDSLDVQPLPDTDDAIEPFWSPDSRSVAFGAQGKLKRLDLGGARAQTLSDAARSNSGSWSPSGVIVFSPDYRSALVRVSATGRDRAPATTLNMAKGEAGGHRYPVFLPDGRHFLYSANRSGVDGFGAVMVGTLDSADTQELLPDFGPALYASPGWLLYLRNGLVVAQPFDANRLELSGEPIPIATTLSGTTWAQGGRVSVSTNGVLVIQNGQAYDYRLAWLDRSGKPAGTMEPARRVAVEDLPRISPDGKRVLVQRRDAQTQNQDLWVGDLARGTYDRFTTDPAQDQGAFWSRDGRRVFCSTVRNGVGGIYSIPVADGRDELLLKGAVFPADESPDGKWLFYFQRGETTRLDIWVLPLTGGDRNPRPLIHSEFDEFYPQISPDGGWIAYASDVTGALEVYVRRFTNGTVSEATRISTGGGVQPRWSRDGRELFFVSGPRGFLDAQMMTVPIQTNAASFEFGVPAPLFKVSMLPNSLINRDYDLSLDGRRFLIGTATSDVRGTPATVVLNWASGLKN